MKAVARKQHNRRMIADATVSVADKGLNSHSQCNQQGSEQLSDHYVNTLNMYTHAYRQVCMHNGTAACKQGLQRSAAHLNSGVCPSDLPKTGNVTTKNGHPSGLQRYAAVCLT